MTRRNPAASVRQRLLNRSKKDGTDYNQLLIRYGIERLLYRLSRSPYRDRFVLKGAMLFAVWRGSLHRPTQDLDLLGFGDPSTTAISQVFRDLCALPVEEDGLVFDPESVSAGEIRAADEYGGIRVHLTGSLGGAVVRLQVDVGFGDVVIPAPVDAEYPVLLGPPSPVLRIYPREAVVAEKLEVIVKLGMLNSRFKDYYDLSYLSRNFEFDGTELIKAIGATFRRRGTALPIAPPVGLTPTFAEDAAKQQQWTAFCRRLTGVVAPVLAEIVAEVADFVLLPLTAAADGTPFPQIWEPRQHWMQKA